MKVFSEILQFLAKKNGNLKDGETKYRGWRTNHVWKIKKGAKTLADRRFDTHKIGKARGTVKSEEIRRPEVSRMRSPCDRKDLSVNKGTILLAEHVPIYKELCRNVPSMSKMQSRLNDP